MNTFEKFMMDSLRFFLTTIITVANTIMKKGVLLLEEMITPL